MKIHVWTCLLDVLTCIWVSGLVFLMSGLVFWMSGLVFLMSGLVFSYTFTYFHICCVFSHSFTCFVVYFRRFQYISYISLFSLVGMARSYVIFWVARPSHQIGRPPGQLIGVVGWSPSRKNKFELLYCCASSGRTSELEAEVVGGTSILGISQNR